MCKFCDAYRLARHFAKKMKKENDINTYLSVRLYENHVRNRQTKATHTHRPMQLVYCPTCGKRLNSRKKKEAANEDNI